MKLTIYSSVFFVLGMISFYARPVSADPTSSMSSRAILATPSQFTARIKQSEIEYGNGKAALQTKDAVRAEVDFRAAIFAGATSEAYYGLAEALTSQGRIHEAIQTYRILFYDIPVKNCIGCDIPAVVEAYQKEFSLKVNADPTRYSRFGSEAPDAWMRYALLLNQTGQWDEAIHFYEKALPDMPGENLPRIDSHFDSNTFQPVAFEAAVHIALGINSNFRGEIDSNDKAMHEYQKALQLAPDWPIANYYYGFGWQRLSPAEKTKFGSEQQAKAALQKAVRLGKGPVKEAAQKALLVAMKALLVAMKALLVAMKAK